MMKLKLTTLAQSVAVVAGMFAGANQIALAQDDESSTSLEEITVTGTRIRRDDFSNPQPTTVVGGEMLENLGIVNLGDAMRDLPANVGNNSPTANPGGNFFNGSNIANLRGLNPFFGSRTLTLVDSRRHVPTNQGDGVDLNFIPSLLVSRMEVVNGGASATYGSGAVGGITNILLDNTLTGFKFQADYGTNFDSDVGGDDDHFGFAWGSEIGDMGHLVVGYEGQRMDAINDCNGIKDWCAEGHEMIQNPAWVAGGTEPQFIHTNQIGNPTNTDQYTTGGLFPLLGFKANNAGSDVSLYDAAADGRHPYEHTTLQSNIERDVLFAHYEHDISDTLGFFVEGSYGSVETRTPQNSLDLTFGFLQADNYYLNQLATNPCVGVEFICFLNKDFTDQILTENHTTTDLKRFVFGFDGDLNENWSWDIYFQWGETDRQQDVLNNRHLHKFNFAMDVVDDGTGNPVCRVTRDGAAAIPPLVDPSLADGCVPINVFGTSGISDAGFGYAFGQLRENTVVEQRMLEGQISGELFEGFGAGSVAAAFGLSWRDESIDNIADTSQTNAERTDYIIQYGESFDGEVEVLEAFMEIDIPVTSSFGINVAARRSEYENTAGALTLVPNQTFDYGITTWKVTGNWEATDWLTLRASQSRDARAPNFRELYYGQYFPPGNPFAYCDNPWTGNRNQGFFTFTGDPCEWFLQGGVDTSPETADTTTIGVVLTPNQFPLRLAVDFYNVEIKDAISQASINRTIDSCFSARDPRSCGLIDGTLLDPNDPLGGWSKIDFIAPTAFNFKGYEVEGYDISADWVQDFDFGVLSSRLIASRNIKQIINPTFGTGPAIQEDISGVNGDTNGFLADWAAQPNWTAQWINTWNNGPVTVTALMRWVSSGKIDRDRIGPDQPQYVAGGVDTIDYNNIGSYSVWSLSGSYDFSFADTNVTVFGTVDNLFDKQPPMGIGNANGTNATYYDTLGRRFRIGVRGNF